MCVLISLVMIIYAEYMLDKPHTPEQLHVLLIGAVVFAILGVEDRLEDILKKLTK